METSREPIEKAIGSNIHPSSSEHPSDSFATNAVSFESEMENAERTPDVEMEWLSQSFVDHERENAYWRDHYRGRSYYRPGRVYFDYQPAFRYGWESAVRREYLRKTFDEAERDLARGWIGKGITWKESRDAVRDAWNRVRDGH